MILLRDTKKDEKKGTCEPTSSCLDINHKENSQPCLKDTSVGMNTSVMGKKKK